MTRREDITQNLVSNTLYVSDGVAFHEKVRQQSQLERNSLNGVFDREKFVTGAKVSLPNLAFKSSPNITVLYLECLHTFGSGLSDQIEFQSRSDRRGGQSELFWCQIGVHWRGLDDALVNIIKRNIPPQKHIGYLGEQFIDLFLDPICWGVIKSLCTIQILFDEVFYSVVVQIPLKHFVHQRVEIEGAADNTNVPDLMTRRLQDTR